MKPIIHELKIEKLYLEAKKRGDKLFEIRCDDRGYQKGDLVVYREYGLTHKDVTENWYEITYVTSYCQPPNQVVFGERKIDKPDGI